MKKRLQVLILFTLLVSIKVGAQDISGSWSWYSDNGNDMFTIDLIKISDNNFRGSHCSVYVQGERIDCFDMVEDFTVVLIRKTENIFAGSIRSGFSFATGQVQLQYLPVDDTILFSLKTPPKGEYYIPFEAVLQRN